MNGEKPYKLVHVLVHCTIESGERRQMFADFALLLGRFLQEPFGHNKFDVAAGDEQLLETNIPPTNAIGNNGKAKAIKDGFLYARHKAEPQVLTHFTYFTEKIQIEDQGLVSAAAKIV